MRLFLMQRMSPLINTNTVKMSHKHEIALMPEYRDYLQELCDTLGEVLVALDVQLQLVESGRQRR